MEVVDNIKGVADRRRGGHQDVPLSDVVIENIEVVERRNGP